MVPDGSRPPHPFVRAPAEVVAERISGAELAAARVRAQPLLLLDVRPIEERRMARLRDDRHIPLSELPGRLNDLPRDRTIVPYDQFGPDAVRASELLLRSGFPRVRFLDAGHRWLRPYRRPGDWPVRGRTAAVRLPTTASARDGLPGLLPR